MADERNQDPQMDAAALYQEEMFTDRKVGAIRRLTPVTATARRRRAAGAVPRPGGDHDEHGAGARSTSKSRRDRSTDAVAGFAPAAHAAIERTVQQIQEMRRQAASQLVVPQGGMPNLGPGPGRGGGKIQLP